MAAPAEVCETILHSAEEDSRPSILVLGGVGMIGRNFVKYLVDNRLCSVNLLLVPFFVCGSQAIPYPILFLCWRPVYSRG